MKEEEEALQVKIITLRDSKNKEQKYMLMQNILGAGKYGKVYKAVHAENPDKVFAVKVIKIQSQKIKEECLKQLQIIKCLPKSLNLVFIHPQHLQSKNNFYLFEQYCNGGNLAEQKASRKGTPMTQQQVFNLFFQIVNGFIDLRNAGIFHQDIKPQNILIHNNIYKITDFGISKLANQIVVTQVRKGTLIYMPPQKLTSPVFVPSSKSQIFSLGVTLFDSIFGFHPFLKKNPKDYKQYLKLVNEAQIKPIEELKSIFPSQSLCIDRLIRTLLKMIEPNESKRLSFQQLEGYIKNTQPFKSMKVSQEQPVAKRRSNQKQIYTAIGTSNVIVKSSTGMGDYLKLDPKGQKLKQNETKKLKSLLQIFKVYTLFFRDSSSFLQQGIVYSKNSKINQFKKIENSSKIGLNTFSLLQQIQFLTLILLQNIFTEFNQVINTILFQEDLQFEYNIEDDKDYISGQLKKFFMDIQAPNKKTLFIQLKQKNSLIPQILSTIFHQTFKNITSLRVNYKDDILAVLFLRTSGRLTKFLGQLLATIVQWQTSEERILSLIGSSQYKQLKNEMIFFFGIENEKKEKVYKQFCKVMKGHQILEDDESNSDQFQILDINDFS